MTAGRRGRPPGRTADWTTLDAEPRIGWLLRSWRTQVRPADNARRFAQEVNGSGLAADVSRVSRWETGQAAAPLEVLKAYESLLDLPPCSLSSIAVALRRTSTRPEPTRSRFNAERLQDGLDAVFDAEPTGAAWLDLATQVAAKPDAITLPSSAWQDLCTRLVQELARAVDHAYLGRAEAANLLTRHAIAAPRLAAAILEYTTRDSGTDADVAGRVSAVLQRYGARAAGSTAGLHDAVHTVAEADRARLLANGAGPAGGRIEPEPTQPLSWARRVIDDSADDDPVLDRLVSEALFHSSYGTRFYAAFTLALSPSRQEVARGAAALMESAPPFVAQRLADLLGFVGTQAEAAVIHRLVGAPPPGLRSAGLAAAMHLDQPADLPGLGALVTGVDEGVAGAALHFAGLTDHPVLNAEAADPGLPESRRFLAQWWQAAGPAIRN